MKLRNLFVATLLAALSAVLACLPATAQWQVPDHAVPIGRGAGTGFKSALCTSAQLLVGQSAADPVCRTITGDVTINAAGATAIGATMVTSAMLNANVYSTAHAWSGQQTFVAPVLGTPASGTLTNATGLPVSTGISGLGSGVAAWLATASSANLRAALTDETGTGAAYFQGGDLGTPSAGVLTNATGLPTAGLVNNAVTNAKAAQMANGTIKGRTTAGTGDPEDMTGAQTTALLSNCIGDSGSGGTKGLVPAAGAGDAAAGKFLKADCTFAVPTGGGGGGMSDTERQNALLDSAYLSKALGDIRRGVNRFATGFKAATNALRGIDAGASSNIDTTNAAASGYVSPTSSETRITGATPTVPLGGTAANINDNNTGTTSTTGAIGNLTAAGVGSRIIAKLDLGSNFVVTKIELKQAKISSGGMASGQGGGLYYSTDNTNWTQLGAEVAVTSSNVDYSRTGSVTARYVAWVATTESFGAITATLSDLNAYQQVFDNMTLVTTAQAADSNVSNGRVLLEYDNVASPALNTDLTAEVTCNGGSNWASASLSSAGTGQSGRKVAESVDQACGASGTSFAARIKTFNGKNIPIHVGTLTVH